MPNQILLVIPRNQFDENELLPIKDALEQNQCRVLVLSKTGNEATGMGKTRFTPDGVLADWNRQENVGQKYDAVIVLGGKGAPKSLWKDDILPQILTDHFRAGKLVAAIGLGVGVLAQAALLEGEASAPEDPALLPLVESAAVAPSGEPLTQTQNVITAEGAGVAQEFAQRVLSTLNHKQEER